MQARARRLAPHQRHTHMRGTGALPTRAPLLRAAAWLGLATVGLPQQQSSNCATEPLSAFLRRSADSYTTANAWDGGEERTADGEQLEAGGGRRSDFDLAPGRLIGVRFAALAVDAAIPTAEARVLFENKRTQRWPSQWKADGHASPVSAGPMTVEIWGELSAASAPMGGATAGDLSARTPTTATVLWDVPAVSVAHEPLSTPDLSDIVAEITAQSGWASGGPVALIFRHASGSGVRWLEAESI